MQIFDDTLAALGFDPNSPGNSSGTYTPETIERRRRLAESMLAYDRPVRGTADGISSVLSKMIGAYNLRKMDAADTASKKEADDLLAKVFGVDLSPSSGTKGSSGFTTSDAKVSPSGGVQSDLGNVDVNDPLSLIKREEGFAPVAAWDRRQFSGGYGSKAAQGETFTREKAEEYLRRDAAGPLAWVEKNAANATPAQKSALVSFGYNLGEDDLEKLKPDIQAGNWQRVGDRMQDFNKALNNKTGRLEVEPGLVKRRARERELILGGNVPSSADGGAVLMPASATSAPNSNMQRALLLMRNPRTAPIGQALLQKAMSAENAAPTIVKVPGPDGGEIAMIYDHNSKSLKPLSSLMEGAQPAQTQDVYTPVSGAPQQMPPQVAPVAPTAPQAPPPAMVENIGEVGPGPLEMAAKTPNAFAGQVPNVAMKGDMGAPVPNATTPLPQAAAQEVVAPMPAQAASQPAQVSDVPPGAMYGPMWRGKIQEGFVQRQGLDGRWLYEAPGKPLLELKSGADARAKGAEKRAENTAQREDKAPAVIAKAQENYERIQGVRDAVQRLRDNPYTKHATGLGGTGIDTSVGGVRLQASIADGSALIDNVARTLGVSRGEAADGIRQAQADMNFIRDNAVLNELSRAREGSSTGASGFGALDAGERELLGRTGSAGLDRSLGEKGFNDNLDRLDRLLARQADLLVSNAERQSGTKLNLPTQAARVNTEKVLDDARKALSGNGGNENQTRQITGNPILDAMIARLGL